MGLIIQTLDQLIDWLIDWLIGWLVDWLIGWFSRQEMIKNGHFGNSRLKTRSDVMSCCLATVELLEFAVVVGGDAVAAELLGAVAFGADGPVIKALADAVDLIGEVHDGLQVIWRVQHVELRRRDLLEFARVHWRHKKMQKMQKTQYNTVRKRNKNSTCCDSSSSISDSNSTFSRSGVPTPVKTIFCDATPTTTHINQSTKLFKKYSPLIDRCRKFGEEKKEKKIASTGIRTPDLETWNWNCHSTLNCSTHRLDLHPRVFSKFSSTYSSRSERLFSWYNPT